MTNTLRRDALDACAIAVRRAGFDRKLSGILLNPLAGGQVSAGSASTRHARAGHVPTS